MRHGRLQAYGMVLLCLAIVQAYAGEKAPQMDAAQLPAELRIALPDGPARGGWELFAKNDFAGAQKVFREALRTEPKNLTALEGLRACCVALGQYREVQKLNMEMLAAAAQSPLIGIFATRAVESMSMVESRAEFLKALSDAGSTASPAAASLLKDYVATLHYQADQADAAREALKGLGYVDQWLVLAGPYGAKDRNNPIEKRFAPERSLKQLDAEKDGEKVIVHKNVPSPNRDLNLDTLFQGSRGIVYAFTNWESDREQDVIIGVSALAPYRAFLRGFPVLYEPEEETQRRSSGELIRVHLVKGANPFMLKLSSAGVISVRLFGTDFSPATGVRVAADDKVLESYTTSALRGQLFSQKVYGMAASALAAGDHKEPLPRATAALKKLAESGTLDLSQAGWLDLALQREGESAARLALARRLALSFPDSVGTLDLSAAILALAGSALGDSGAREAEEARTLREHALAKMPDAHQHLVALYQFFQERNLDEQAFAFARRCVEAHPASAMAQMTMGDAFEHRKFYPEAEKCFEKAAELDHAFLSRLISFHDSFGNRARADQLRKQLVESGKVELRTQLDLAVQHGALDEADALLKKLEAAFPERKDEWAQQRIRLLQEKGDFDQACTLQAKLYEAQARDSGSRRGLLTDLVELKLRLKQGDDARRLIAGYLKDHPTDLELRQRLAELDGSSQPHWWDPYDVNVRQIDTSAYNNEKYPAANHAWIVDFMVTRVHADLSSESYTHIAQKVLNLQGINELSELLVRAQRQDMIFVRTLNPDGGIFEPQNVHDFNLAQSASLYKVGPGSVLEHAYLMNQNVDENEPVFNMGFNFNAIDAPRAVSRWVVMIADGAKDKLKIRKIRPEMIDEQILPGPPGFTVYQWTNKKVEGIKLEPMMPGEQDQEVIPLVLVETPLPPFRANGWLMRREKNDLPPEALAAARQIVASPKLAAAGETRKFEAILAWIRENIQYGEDSHTLSDVWFLRSGRTDQMTQLAREMAQGVGLNVRMAYVNGAYLPGLVWHSKTSERNWEPMELANFGSGGRMLVLEPALEADSWAQFVGRQPRTYWPGDLTTGQAGALALTVGDDGVRLKRVWGERTATSPIVAHLEVHLDNQGTGAVDGLLKLNGVMGGNWREALTDPRQQEQLKERVVRFAWPKCQINDVTVLSQQSASMPLGFKYSCTVQGLAGAANGAMFLKPFLNKAHILELRGPPERQHDILIKAEVADLDHTLTYIAPEGSGWVEVPNDQFIVTEFGFYLVDYNVQGQRLTCTRSYLMPQQRIPPDKYAKVLEFLDKIAAAEEQRIAYAPLPLQSFGPYRREVFSLGYAGNGE